LLNHFNLLHFGAKLSYLKKDRFFERTSEPCWVMFFQPIIVNKNKNGYIQFPLGRAAYRRWPTSGEYSSYSKNADKRSLSRRPRINRLRNFHHLVLMIDCGYTPTLELRRTRHTPFSFSCS
jgi:hypothetical protein